MPNTFTPSDVALVTVTEPVDGEPRTVASVTQMTRAIADGVIHAYGLTDAVEAMVDTLESNMTLKLAPFTSDGTWVAPAGVTKVLIIGYGGGGGGGGGMDATTTINNWGAGGGGGGGALVQCYPVTIIPGDTYNVDVGTKGFGGAGGADGTSGGPSIFRLASATLARFDGAKGGQGAAGGKVVGLWEHITPGGEPSGGGPGILIGFPSQNIRYDTSDAMWSISSIYLAQPPACGGYGCGSSTLRPSVDGCLNPSGGFNGGVHGPAGTTDSGSYPRGGGGGGGAAGPGGHGGAGGAGTDGGTLGPAGDGVAAVVNTGAGGGGGGTAGQRSASPGTGGVGGDGGTGLVIVCYVSNS